MAESSAKKFASAALAGILACGMCVPAAGVAAFANLATPSVAMAVNSVDEQAGLDDTAWKSVQNWAVSEYQVCGDFDDDGYIANYSIGRPEFWHIDGEAHNSLGVDNQQTGLTFSLPTSDLDAIDVAFESGSVSLANGRFSAPITDDGEGNYTATLANCARGTNDANMGALTPGVYPLVVTINDQVAATASIVVPHGTEADGWVDMVNGNAAAPVMLTLTTPASARMTSDSAVATQTQYTAFKLFSANVNASYNVPVLDEEGNLVENTAPKASNISTDNADTYATILTDDFDMVQWLRDNGHLADDADEDAISAATHNVQNQAEYVAFLVGEHRPGTDIKASENAMALARVLMASGITGQDNIKADEAVELAGGEGYYLIVKTDELTGESTAASTPIYAALDAGDNEIMLKVAIPTITKQVKEDHDQSWGDEADHTLNQDVDYKLIGTVAENVDSYPVYGYEFNDAWNGDRMALSTDEEGNNIIAVTIDGKDVTAQATITPVVDADDTTDGNQTTLSVKFDDLKKVVDPDAAEPAEGEDPTYLEITPDTEVVVSYTAHQTGVTTYEDAASAATDGIQNSAFLQYANNTMVATSMGQTPVVNTKDYSYSIRLHKEDNATHEPLAGVEFSFKGEHGYLGIDENGKFVDTLAAPYSFVTDANGDIHIYGIDADEYAVAEEQAKEGYEKLDGDYTATIAATPITNDDDEVIGLDRVNLTVGSTTSDLFSRNADDDTVSVSLDVKNIKQIPLPSTGEAGLMLIFLLAVAAAVVAVSRRRKMDQAKVMSL